MGDKGRGRGRDKDFAQLEFVEAKGSGALEHRLSTSRPIEAYNF